MIALPLSDQDAELVSLALVMIACCIATPLAFHLDERRLSEEQLERALPVATRRAATAAVLLIGPIAPTLWFFVHVLRTRRGARKLFAIPAALGYAAFVFLLLVVIGVVFDAAGVTKP